MKNSLLLSEHKNLKYPIASGVEKNKLSQNFYGVNWADPRDNFEKGNLYLSGLDSTDTYNTASIVAGKIIGQMMTLLGSNSVRMPINESTVSNFWGTYTGAIDKALSLGKVILCYWAYSGGKPASMTDFWNMWTKVINTYGSNNNCYFEPINEPWSYSDTALCNLYYSWITKFPSVPQSRVILDGGGSAQRVAAVGSDSRLINCRLAVHEYSFFVSPPYTTEAAWSQHLAGYVGSYAARTICTEWGYPCSPGSKNGVSYGYIDYSPGLTSNFFYYYARGVADQLSSWGMGSFYWPGLRDGDWYSMTKKTGSDSTIVLSVPNASALINLRRGWGITTSILKKDSTDMPTHFILGQNYPNPFNPTTEISYSIPKDETVTLKVYDILGREVATLVDEEKSAGTYTVEFDGNRLSSGTYYYCFQAGNFVENKKMILLK